jgi:hypothetical protein
MADTSTFVVASLDGTLANARVLTAGKGLNLVDSGPGDALTINPGDHLASIVALSFDGIVTYANGSKTFGTTFLGGTSTIEVLNGGGPGGIFANVIPNTSRQNVLISDGITTLETPSVNFAAGQGVTLGVANVSGVPTVTISSDGQSMFGGTVTSVAATSSDLTITGSPITVAGTLNFSLNTVSIAKGGTGQTTAITAFNALSPNSTTGDISYFDGTNNVRLPVGTTGQALTVAGGIPTWSTPAPGGVTSVAVTSGNAFLTVSGSPITSSGTIALNVGTLALANGGTGLTGSITSGQNGIIGFVSGGTSLIPIVPSGGSGSGAAGAVLRTSPTGSIVWSSQGIITGQVLVIGPASQGVTWCNNPTANGQVLTYVSSAAGVSWQNPSSGTVTSVDVTSSDITVGGTPITSSGTVTLSLNTVSIAKGGTGQVTKTLAFNALSPNSTTGDISYFDGTNNVRLPVGTTGQALTVVSGLPAWSTAGGGSGTVTSVGITSSDSTLTVTNTPITTSGNIALALNVAGLTTKLVSQQYAGLTSAPTGNQTYTIPSTKVLNNSIILVTFGAANGGNLDSSDYGNCATVDARNVGVSFQVRMTHATSVLGSNYYLSWLIINP